jgi:hypothetical protein
MIVTMNTGRLRVGSSRIHRVRNAGATSANIAPISPLISYVAQSLRMRGDLTLTSRYASKYYSVFVRHINNFKSTFLLGRFTSDFLQNIPSNFAHYIESKDFLLVSTYKNVS